MKKISLILAAFVMIFGFNISCSFAGSRQAPVADYYVDADARVVCTWSDSDPDVISYTVRLYDARVIDMKDTVSAGVSSYQFPVLMYGDTYNILVTANYSDGTTLDSNVMSFYFSEFPFTPLNLKAAVNSNGSVTLTWKNRSHDILQVEITEDGSNGDGGVTTIDYSGQDSYTLNYAHKAGITYKYRIRTVNIYSKKSNYSDEASVTIPNSASDVPSSCAAQQQTDGSVKVTWKDNSNWETGFTVMRTDGSGTNKYFEAAANATFYTDTEKLTAGATYKYKVCAHDDNGQTDYSNQVSVSIPAATATTPAITAPAAPSNLTAKQDQDKIKLTWQDNSDNETGFTITRTDDKTKTSTTTTVAAGTKSYTDAQGIEAGTTYTYALKAVNSAGSSSEAKVSISATGTIATGLNFDGTQSSWAKTEITAAYNDGLTYDGVLSDFGRNITREEFCTIVVKMYEKISGKTATASDDPFTDTSDANILKAYKLGIVKGTSATTFSPDSKITRQEICVMITRCLESSVSGINISSKNELAFADKGQIASWAKESMGFCNQVGIMNGVGSNKIAPLSNTTREQAIALIERTFQEYK